MRDPETEIRRGDPLIDEAAVWLAKLRSPAGPAEQQAFESWYASNAAHADAYDQVLRGWEAAGSSDDSTVVPLQQPRARSIHRRGGRQALAAATVILLVVLSGIGLKSAGIFGSDRAPRETELASRTGEIRTFRLDDGSRVTLDTGSRLRVVFSPGERRIELERGRARFDVAHDASRSFIVVAGAGSIIARGTLFDVALVDARVTVALLRGSVEVRGVSNSTSGDRSPGARLLAPGQGLVVSRSEPLPQPRPLRAAETRWISGMLTFEDAQLADVIAAANRYNVAQIVLTDSASRELRFTGTFRATDPAGLARMLAAMFQLRLSEDAKGNFLLGAPAK